MSRVHDSRPARAAGKALDVIPARILDLLHFEFVIGVDPTFAGIHGRDLGTIDFSHGSWDVRDLAHVTYPHLQTHRPRSDRSTKVILPSNPEYRWDTWAGVETVVHELGHVLHERIGWDFVAEPVSDYAKTNRYEAFAEAFAAWVWYLPVDEKTQALFDNL